MRNLSVIRLGLVVCCCLMAPCAVAQNVDSPENRAALSAKYFSLLPMRKMVFEMGEQMAMTMPPDSRKSFMAYWERANSPESIARIETAARESLARHMTVEELSAFIRFLEDPAGRSAMDKMKLYMADVMPVIQQHAMQAMGQYGRDEAGPQAGPAAVPVQ